MKNIFCVKHDEELNFLIYFIKKCRLKILGAKKYIVSALAIVILMSLFSTGVFGISYNVFINGVNIGKVKNKKELMKVINLANEKENINFNGEIKMYPAISFMTKTTADDKIYKNYAKIFDKNITFEIAEAAKVFSEDAIKAVSSNVSFQAVPAISFLPAFAKPINAAISSEFGQRWGRMHNGIDFAANEGDIILATDSGMVKFSGYEETFGNFVIIEHGSGYESYYAHMSKRSVTEGEIVSKGQKIGEVGSTGNSTGPHLHFEIRLNGIAVNPADFIVFQ